MLVATGYAVDGEVQALVAVGVRLLEKPFTAGALRREVAALVPAGELRADVDTRTR